MAQSPSLNIIEKIVGFFLVFNGVLSKKHPEPYYGTKIGPLQQFAHGIRGTVYAVDETTIFIKGFSYDGTGPDAFFWIGNSPRPSPEGIIIPYPEDYHEREPPVLKAHNNSNIILRLPMGKRIRDIRWLSVWCRRFTVDFGEVFIPPNLEVPKPRVLPEFKRLAHGLRSDNISILDAKTFYIPNLHYDGAGPDAYFWVGNGSEPNSFGYKVPNELGSYDTLRGYLGEDIEIQLPGTLTVYDIDWLAVWCVQYRHNFGHVMIPKDLDVPPALGQTKISTTTTAAPPTPTNCREFLDKRLQVKWLMTGDRVEVTLSARIGEDKYIAFGLSGQNNKAQMIGADVTVAYFDKETRSFRADDYYISHLSQCDGKSGVCPDERIGGRNDVIVLHGERSNGVTTIKYSRPLHTNEAINDRPIPENSPISVIAAFGPLNSRMEVNAHTSKDRTGSDEQINFSDVNDHQCTLSLDDLPPEDGIPPWPPAKLIGENVFNVKIGPTGGVKGYSKITGLPSWGICYYINDKLIPELTVERGQTYTFVVEGGESTTNPARFHPLYITDSNEGAFGQLTPEKQQLQQVFAGVAFDRDGYPYPTATGRYCEWAHKSIDKALESATFEDYMKTLRLECDEGEPAYMNWTVPMDAPDLLYYQCYIHSNLGWKIHVVDPGYVSQQNGEKISSATKTTSTLTSLLSILPTINLLMTIISRST
ncbi:protein Skeletor, isoforms B/C isoform X2 [Anthonomus grandis grandis]|uniref:protein Skeletor, isoforms B/C isoform X2 n=1 Tax=Anthonomus grandis grandis TaxID=2921223 RepID=UPI0021656402|nr:protein Skeletor, isoforms B/C isoform X2 [Anthonomus grandis grandis]